MDRTIIDNINAVVGPNDTLWFLGDFAFVRDLPAAQRLRDRIACQHINIVWGNHDRRWIAPLFERQYEQWSGTIEGQAIFMNHFPCLSWDRSFHGSWGLHGHCHGNANDFVAKHLPNARMLDVGVDSHDFRPWSFDEVAAYMKDKTGKMATEKSS